MPMIDTRQLRQFADDCQRAFQSGTDADCRALLGAAAQRMLRLAGDIDELQSRPAPQDDGA